MNYKLSTHSMYIPIKMLRYREIHVGSNDWKQEGKLSVVTYKTSNLYTINMQMTTDSTKLTRSIHGPKLTKEQFSSWLISIVT